MLSRRTLVGALSASIALASAPAAFAQDEIYIPLISKGFQHQFWQAVKSGADQAAEEFGVRITFEGPDNETMVDRQIDMLAAALANKPAAIAFAALDSQAAIPLLRQASEVGIPIIAFDSGVTATFRCLRQPLTTSLLPHWPLTRCRNFLAEPAPLPLRLTIRPAAQVSTVSMVS
jgi:ABC-type sugar transport system substrate-binding protein